MFGLKCSVLSVRFRKCTVEVIPLTMCFFMFSIYFDRCGLASRIAGLSHVQFNLV